MTQLDVSRTARTRSTPRPGTRLDADGDPVWHRSEGQTLVPDVAAWRRLGVGLRCETWLGWSLSGWHPVLVKLARPHQVAHPRAWAALTREAYVLSRARHPNLPVLYANHVDADCPYVVTEYVDGPDLADVLDDGGPLDALSAARLAAQLLSALTAVHATGAAHLDLKPENVMIRDGRPVLIDFGSARPLGSSQPAGRPLGTAGYAAPELEACEPITAAMDVYGVGVVLVEALTGRPPGPGCVPGTEPGSRALGQVAGRLTERDPRLRPSLTTAQALLARAVEPERLWPAFVRLS